MYSDRSDHGQRRQYGDRGARPWDDDYSDRWDDKHEPHRNVQRNSYNKYSSDKHNSTERTNRSREYSDSHQMLYSKESLNKERSRRSPVRRRLSSPDWSTPENKRRRFLEDNVDDYKYRREPDDDMYRQSPDCFAHKSKDFKYTSPKQEDLRYRTTHQDSRNRHRHEDVAYRHGDLNYRRSSGHYSDRNGQRSQERNQSQDSSAKNYAKARERTRSPPTDHKDHHKNRMKALLDGSSGWSHEHDVIDKSPASPQLEKSTRGFQRFLDVLNKGVNVDTLTKIVTRTSVGMCDHPQSPASFQKAEDAPWEQEGQVNTQKWKEREERYRQSSPQQCHRSFSPDPSLPPDEKSGQGRDGGLSSDSRSRSPAEVEKVTPEDEHKHRHMQGVLQAIGMDLGFEELGQMSHRIQERLYGKKGHEWDPSRKRSRERVTKPAFSQRHRSRSSSSRSSFEPLTLDSQKKHSHDDENDVTEVHQVQVHQSIEYSRKSSSSSLQDSQRGESQESPTVFPAYSANVSHTASQSPNASALPSYSPVNNSPVLYPPLPPNLPHVGPRLLLPHLPPFLPYPCVPPLNIFPTVLAQTRQIFPQQVGSPQPPYLNLPNLNPVQPLGTTQKSKPLSRPRCLQVIETKQAR
ncbi:uncharacterized protein ACBR49_001182 [Aulostomus maculatus]